MAGSVAMERQLVEQMRGRRERARFKNASVDEARAKQIELRTAKEAGELLRRGASREVVEFKP